MSQRSTHHVTFVIERRYDAPPARVFAAFADPAISDRWFVKSNNWPVVEYSHDFRVGGRESGRFSPDGTTMIFNDTVYRDIVPGERIISAYTMSVGERRMSASLATIELFPDGAGTRLTHTEQGAFLDVLDQAADRERGCAALFDNLGEELRRQHAAA